MAFTAYWKTTTGFNTQDYPVIIGKKLKECSVAELTGHPMCGSMSLWGNAAFTAKSSDLGYSDVMPHLTGGVMFKEPIISNKSDIQVNEPANNGDTAKIYRRSIFIAWKSNVSLPQHSIDDTCSDDIYIVDNITAPNKLVCNYTNASGLGTGDNAAVKARVCGYQLRHTCQKGQTAYGSAPSQLVYTDNTDPNHPITTNYYLGTAFVYVVDDNAFVVIDDHVGHFGFRWQSNNTSNQYNFLSDGADYKSFKSANNYRFFIGMNPNGTNREATLAEIFPGCFADPVPDPAVFVNSNSYTTTVSTILGSTIKLKFSLYNSTIGGAMASRGLNFSLSGDTALEARLQQICRQGTYFVFNGELLKPIIVGGVVVGYGTPEKVSEIDTYRDLNHPVPTGPGGGGGGDDDQDSDWDDIAINGAGIGGGSAFCRFYYCTEAELANLRTWTMGLSSSGDNIPGGFDPKSNIIGLTVFPFTISGNGPTTIKFTTNGGQDPITQQPMPRVVDSGVSCEGGAGATTRILNATINVPATMKNRGEPWLDYESYVELFIPMCGIYQVDPQVVIGRTIHVEIFLDPVSGTVMGIAWVPKENGKCIIAQGSGTPGVQIPVAVGNYGLAQAARVQNTLNGFGNTASSAISNQVIANAYGVPGSVSPTISDGKIKIGLDTSAKGRIGSFNNAGRSSALGYSGLLSSVQHWVSARQIANSPGTSATGGFSGSMAEWCGVFTPYVKIVRPKFRKPENYKHTCGEPEVIARKLNSVGYAICINPDISGLTNATDAERMVIYQFLSTGVYYK